MKKEITVKMETVSTLNVTYDGELLCKIAVIHCNSGKKEEIAVILEHRGACVTKNILIPQHSSGVTS